MKNKGAFADRVNDELRVAGYKPLSPSTLLTQWEELVRWCEEGYQWDVSEYNNELQVRSKLEIITTSERLRGYPEVDVLRARVESIDERFRQLLKPDVKLESRSNWWEQGILSKAGLPYASYFRDAHGIDVEVVRE